MPKQRNVLLVQEKKQANPIPFAKMTPHIVKSILCKMTHSDLLKMGKTQKSVSNFILENARMFPNRREIYGSRFFPTDVMRFHETNGHLPGKLDFKGTLTLLHADTPELKRQFLWFCKERNVRVENLAIRHTEFFVEALQASRPSALLFHSHGLIDSSILGYKEIQNTSDVTLYGEIERLGSTADFRCSTLDLNGFTQLHLGALNGLLKNLNNGVFNITYYVFHMAEDSEINSGELNDMLHGVDATLYWVAGRQGLPLSHKKIEEIRPSAIAVFTIKNKKDGSIILGRVFLKEVSLEALDSGEDSLLFKAWDAIRNSSAYPL